MGSPALALARRVMWRQAELLWLRSSSVWWRARCFITVFSHPRLGSELVSDAPVPRSMHAGQLAVSVETVRALVADQFPQWTNLIVEPVRSEGTVNAIFRLGDRLAARFPLQPKDLSVARTFLQSEAEANRELVGRTRFPVPEPVAIGEPGYGYPLPWSIQTWLDGVTATVDDPGGSAKFANDLAEFITDVRAIETRGRLFSRPGRGGDLRAHDEWVKTCLCRSEGLVDVVASWEVVYEFPSLSVPS